MQDSTRKEHWFQRNCWQIFAGLYLSAIGFFVAPLAMFYGLSRLAPSMLLQSGVFTLSALLIASYVIGIAIFFPVGWIIGGRLARSRLTRSVVGGSCVGALLTAFPLLIDQMCVTPLAQTRYEVIAAVLAGAVTGGLLASEDRASSQ